MVWQRDMYKLSSGCMNRAWPEKGSLPHKLANVLFRYRNTPHSTTDKTSSQLFLKREPRTYLSLVKPSLQRHLVRVPGNDRRFVHANHLIPDDTRDLGSHLEKVAPSVLKKNPFLDLQGGSLSPGKSSQIPSKDNSEMSRKSEFLYQLLIMISN